MQPLLGHLSILQYEYTDKCSSCPGRGQQETELAHSKKSNSETYSHTNVCSLGEQPVEEHEGSERC